MRQRPAVPRFPFRERRARCASPARPASTLVKRMAAGATLGALAFAAVAWPGMGAGGAPAAAAAPPPLSVAMPDEATLKARVAALQRAQAAVVRLRVQAVDDAQTLETLGPMREGSGVVIDASGLVLTVSYLLLEAERVEIELSADRVVPGRVVAVDTASGFGLVQPLVPLRTEPVPLGRSAALRPDQPLVSISGGDAGSVAIAQALSQRPFSGTWEYHLDQALYTAPLREDHSGAALFDVDGALVGIGSLALRDVNPPEDPSVRPGNLYLPIDLLRPILDELRTEGRSASSRRPWLGVSASEADGQVRVMRVNREGPAAEAGLRPGDRIESVDGQPVKTLEQLYKALWRQGPAPRTVTLDVRRSGQVQSVTVQAVDRQSVLRRSRGI